MVLGIFSSALLVFLIYRMGTAGQDVERSDHVIKELLTLETTLVEMQSSARSFSMDQEDNLPQHVVVADSTITEKIASLKSDIVHQPEQLRQLLEIESLYGNAKATQDSMEMARHDKLHLIAQMREGLKKMIAKEKRLRAHRDASASNLFVFLIAAVIATLVAGNGLLALMGRKNIHHLSYFYRELIRSQDDQFKKLQEEEWYKSKEMSLASRLLQKGKLDKIMHSCLTFLSDTFSIPMAAASMKTPRGSYYRIASIGIEPQKQNHDSDSDSDSENGGSAFVKLTAQNKVIQCFKDVPLGTWINKTKTGTVQAQCVVAVPIIFDEECLAVLELGFVEAVDCRFEELMKRASSKVGGIIRNAISKERLGYLLNEVQSKSDELIEQQQELKEKARALQKASQYKSEFLANMSHELRTPLNSSMILAQILAENKEQNLSDKQVGFCNQILRSGRDLLMIIDDILDLAKVESGKLEIAVAPFKVREVCESISSTFSPLAQQKGLSFSVNCHCPSAEIQTDRLRLEQILKNLVSNAVKFTHKGYVNLDIRQYPIGNGDEFEFEFSVSDSGIGIDKEKLTVIFESFRQADGATTRNYGGTGLGLSISNNLTALLSGSLSVTSTPQKGSQFILRLPEQLDPQEAFSRAEVLGIPEFKRQQNDLNSIGTQPTDQLREAMMNDEARPQKKSSLLNGARIMIIDSDFRNAFSISASLENEGAKTEMVGNQDDALNCLKTVRDLDLVLIDLATSEIDVYNIIQKIRGHRSAKNLPIIALTNDANTVAFKQYRELGVSDMLTKPLEMTKLAVLVNSVRKQKGNSLCH